MAFNTVFTWGPDNVDSLLTTTKSVIQQTKEFLNDAIFTRITLLKHLNDKKRVTRQGGASILTPLLFGKNETFKAYSGYDIIDTTAQEGMTMAQTPWRNYGGTISFNGTEMRQNAGNGKIFDLAKAKTIQATMSARDVLNSDMFSSTQGAKKVAALPVLVDATSTVQDVNSTTNSWWQAQVITGGAFPTQGLADMRTLRNQIIDAGMQGGMTPDFIVTTQTVQELYEASQVPQLRYGVADKMDPSKAESLLFAGAPIEFDSNCASGELYMLPSDALEFVVNMGS